MRSSDSLSPSHFLSRFVSRLFRDRLHENDGYVVHFARRGSSDRTEALGNAWEPERRNIRLKFGINATAPIEIRASEPSVTGCLQVADYNLKKPTGSGLFGYNEA